jgi:hypothetical protein
MNSVQKQNRIISLSLIATPIICLLLGVLGRLASTHELNDDGADFSLILPHFGFIIGLAGSLIGLVIGALTASLTPKSNRHNYALYAYLLPASASILIMLFGLLPSIYTRYLT